MTFFWKLLLNNFHTRPEKGSPPLSYTSHVYYLKCWCYSVNLVLIYDLCASLPFFSTRSYLLWTWLRFIGYKDYGVLWNQCLKKKKFSKILAGYRFECQRVKTSPLVTPMSANSYTTRPPAVWFWPSFLFYLRISPLTWINHLLSS